MVKVLSWSWVTNKVVRPRRRCMARISTRTLARGRASRLDSGSSSKNTLVHHSASQRHALLLAAGKLGGPAVGEAVQPHQAERVGHAAVALGARYPAHLQAEAHVLRHRHVREQCVILEHHARIARVRRRAGHVAAADEDVALAGGD